MSADLSRIRSNPLLDYAGVELKQGAVLLDADFNEHTAVTDRRLRALASDVLGRSMVSSTTPDAFKIGVTPNGSLSIGQGRLYVDGLLAENHGAPAPEPVKKLFDPLLAEPHFADAIDYGAQPYLPGPKKLPIRGTQLVYLDVWQREVTHVQQPGLVEVAVGVETSSRLQTVWQVKLQGVGRGSSCATPDEELEGWSDLTARSSGRLSTGTFEVPPADDPCELPPTGGYRGLENQTYRIEIHDGGQGDGTATFKWSRDNGSIVSAVTSVISGSELELETLGRDDVLRFNSGDWVEITDDVRELSSAPGEMRRIVVTEAMRRITFAIALPADMVPAPNSNPRERNLRVTRWDHNGTVRRIDPAGTTTSVFHDLDASTSGVIPVPPDNTTLILENGVTVTFASGGSGAKGFRPGDYWVNAARTADASVETLTDEPPRGIHHHYERLAVWEVEDRIVTDCRHHWPPAVAEGHDCGCTACVTPESHSGGKFTIQEAVDKVRESGGTVCLSPGHYPLREPVRLVNVRSVRIRGQGPATMLSAQNSAFVLQTCAAVAIENLGIVATGIAPAIDVRTVIGLTLRRSLPITCAHRRLHSAAW
jgi:hypothetical protein